MNNSGDLYSLYDMAGFTGPETLSMLQSLASGLTICSLTL